MPDSTHHTTPDASVHRALREALGSFHGMRNGSNAGPILHYRAQVTPAEYEDWQAAAAGLTAWAPHDDAHVVDHDGSEPTHLRWGLNDVMWGDDDTITVMLSGPQGEPYWLELNPERAAALREDLAGPDGEEQPAETQDCDRRTTVLYFIQTQQPDGSWVDSSGGFDSSEYTLGPLAERRKWMPEFEHRIVRHTTTATMTVEPFDPDRPAVVEQPEGCRRCGHRACMGKGRRCGVVLTSDTGIIDPPCQCTGPGAGEQPEADRIVAYRSPGTRTLYCVICARQEHGWQPVTAAKVQDDTACDFCGGRVLKVAARTLGHVIARYVHDEQDQAQQPEEHP